MLGGAGPDPRSDQITLMCVLHTLMDWCTSLAVMSKFRVCQAFIHISRLFVFVAKRQRPKKISVNKKKSVILLETPKNRLESQFGDKGIMLSMVQPFSLHPNPTPFPCECGNSNCFLSSPIPSSLLALKHPPFIFKGQSHWQQMDGWMDGEESSSTSKIEDIQTGLPTFQVVFFVVGESQRK